MSTNITYSGQNEANNMIFIAKIPAVSIINVGIGRGEHTERFYVETATGKTWGRFGFTARGRGVWASERNHRLRECTKRSIPSRWKERIL